MSKWKQRVISLLLAVSMVFGLTQGNVLQVEAASSGNLGAADGIIWLAKEGDGVSKEFSDMIEKQLKLDDMVRDALGEPAGTKVYFDGVNVGNAVELYLNQDKIESMIEQMKTAIKNKEHVMFNIGSADGEAKSIAFRSMEMTISVGGSDEIYIKNAGAPASAKALETMISEALDNAVVSVEHNGTVETKGFYTENKTGFKATAFAKEGGVSYNSLLKKWPTATSSPDSNTRRAGTVDVTIYAAEYSQNPSDPRFKKTETFEIYMYDQRITVNAAAEDSAGNLVQDDELKSLTKSYSTNQAPGKNEQPVSDYYRFVDWMTPGLDGCDYTAIMKAKIDNNKNGIHDDFDELKEFTVTYYVDGEPYGDPETVTEGNMPKGPSKSNPVNDTVTEGEDEEGNKFEISYVFAGWETETGAKWPTKVTGDVSYHATWKEIKTMIPTDPDEPVVSEEPFTVTGTLRIDGTATAPQPLEADLKKADSDGSGSEYQIVDPGWAESLARDGYKCVGWYYKVAEGTEGAEDINKDGKKEEIVFDFSSVWNTNRNPNNGDELNLYCEFLPTVEVYDPETGETKEEAKGEATKTYSYTIKDSAGTVIGTLPPSLTELDTADLPVPEYNERVSSFNGWTVNQISETEYEVTASFTHKMNTVRVSENLIDIVSGGTDEDGATYKFGDYTSVVSIDGVVYVEDENGSEKHTYAVDPNTSVSITPFRNENQEIGFYVTGLTAYHNGVPYSIPVTYDQDYNAEATEIYSTINARTRTVESLGGVELVPQYAQFKFKPVAEPTLPAAQNSYSAKNIYEAVLNYDASLSYDPEKVEVLYKAQEDSYKVSLNRLFELLEKDGLGSLRGMIGDQYDSLEVTPPENHDTWESVEDNSAEVTAQEVANAYLEQKYAEYKADSNIDILQFVGEVVDGLGEVVYNGAHHKFGYIAPTNVNNPTEELRITYDSDAIDASAEFTVNLTDSRSTITITRENVTCSYGTSIVEKIMEGVICSEPVEGEFVTYDAETKTVRDYSGVSVGTYKIQIAFVGNDTVRPAMSNEFTLTVKAAETTVTVPSMVTMEGNMYDEDPSATVSNDAPIVQVIAGIATDELAYGLNTDGDVKDWTLGFDDENLMIDAWVKLPQSYIELLGNLDMIDLEEYGVEIPVDSIEEGKYYTVENLEAALEKYDIEQVEQLQSLLDEIPEIIQEKLGISDLTYGIKVRFDALEKNVYPTNPGFYVNYAATLSRFNNSKIDFDKNYEPAEDYGFIVISPMAPIPNRGGVQLFGDGISSNAQNVFVYEYNGTAVERDLEVAVNGSKLDGEKPFYYGLTTRFDATKEAPTMPGVYFAGYNYTEEVYNEDSGEMELRRLGSDSAIIIIKQREAELTITGGVYEYEEGVTRIADVKITDKYGAEINDGGVTVISGTVNVNDDGTNVTANDFRGAVNIDMPDVLKAKWDAFWAKTPYNNSEVIRPADFITFLEESRDAAITASNKGLDAFKDVAMKDAVSSALDKINVSSDTLISGADKAQNLLDGGVAYYNELLAQLEPLRALNDNLELTFKDVSELDYSQTGYYLYMGVITDPDLTVDAAKGLVIIHSEDDYVMYDTHVPYNGKEQTIYMEDETNRSDVTVMVKDNEISFFLDSDVYEAMNTALSAIPLVGEEVTVGDGSDAVVSTVYENAEGKASEVYSKIFNLIWNKVSINVNLEHGEETVTDALNAAEAKLNNLTARLSARLQAVDNLDGDTRIVLYNMSSDADLKGMPIDAGTYQFYGYDYDVAATRGTLVIEPIYIQVDDYDWVKAYREDDPAAENVIEVLYYYKDSRGDKVYLSETEVPDDENDLISYSNEIYRTGTEDVGIYDMKIADLTLNEEYAHNYRLDDLSVDDQDFEICPAALRLEATVTPGTIVVGESAVVEIKAYDIRTGEEVTDVELTYVINNDPNLTLETACNTVDEYIITPALGENVKNYAADVNDITSATLIVEEDTDVVIPVLECTVKISPSRVVLGTLTANDINLEVEFRDNLGTDPEKLKLDYFSHYDIQSYGYSIGDVNRDGVVDLDDALANVGTYEIVPIYKGNPEQTYADDEITKAVLRVIAPELPDDPSVPVLHCKVTVSPKQVVIGTLTADDISVNVYFEDNLGTDPEELRLNYFSHYDIQSQGYSIGDVNEDGVVDLNDALAKVGTYFIVPIYKGNPETVYADDVITRGILRVVNPDTPVEPEEPEERKDIISIWVSTDYNGFVAGTVTDVEEYINPKLHVALNGRSLDPESALYDQLNPSFKLLDSNNNEVELSQIGNQVDTYKFVIDYTSISEYDFSVSTKYITVSAKQLNVSAAIYRNGSIARAVPVGTSASEYEVILSAWDNIGSERDTLAETYLDGFIIVDAGGNEVSLQTALNNVGDYTIKPVVKGNPEDVYGTKTIVYNATLKVSIKVVEVNPIVTYNGIDYTRDEIAWKHPATMGTRYEVKPTAFWANDCDADEQQHLEDNIDGVVEHIPENITIDQILNNRGTYIFKASGTTTLDPEKYALVWGTRILDVVQIGAQARIRPKANSEIFTTVDDTTYKLLADQDAQTILDNLSLSVTDDHGNTASSDLITGLKVTKLDTVSTMMLRRTNSLNELEQLKNPGTYLIETVISEEIGGYSAVEPDSIVVIVEAEIGTIEQNKAGWVMTLDSVVYLKYYPKLTGFSEGFDFANRAGVVIWTGESAPTSRYQIEAGKPNTMDLDDGWEKDGNGKWFVRTHEIYAKNLGDMVYIRPYVVNNEGEYVYMDAAPYYSPQLFAYDVMHQNGRDQDEKNVCGALLKYGASAQIYFGYDTENLVTNIPQGYGYKANCWDGYDLEYDSSYADKVVVDDHVKELAGTLKNIGEIQGVVTYPKKSALNLVGAIRMRTGFDIDTNIIDLDQIEKAEVLYWNERDFANIESLEYSLHNYNWSSALEEVPDDKKDEYGDYIGTSDHIVAKYLSESIYCTCRIVMQDGTTYNSGLVYYSPEQFALDWINKADAPETTKDLCKMIVVYSEMAKRCFLK